MVYNICDKTQSDITSIPITETQHAEIMKAMNENTLFYKRNPQVIAILITESSTGLRLGDVLSLTLSQFRASDKGYRLKIKEKKTGKERDVPIPAELYAYLTEYAMSRGRKRDQTIFTLTPRAVTKYIKKVTDYLGLENVSSHSWRKMYCLQIYEKSGNDLVAVQQAMLHSSLAVTQRYLNRRSEKLESILQKHCNIVNLEEE